MVMKVFEVEVENLHAAIRRAEEYRRALAKKPDEPDDPKLWSGIKKETAKSLIQSKEWLRGGLLLESIYEEDNESMASSRVG